jgi:hypothetical protein
MRAVYKVLLGIGLSSCATALLGSPASSAAASTCERPVYLTFDTGHMQVAPLVAEVLARQQVRATFFWQMNPHARAAQAWMRFGLPGGGHSPSKGMPLPRTRLITFTG